MSDPAQAAVCDVCPRHCRLMEGQPGFCRARTARGEQVVYAGYGKLSALALDPIEKKPLYHFHPGSSILSVGGYGCNLRCGFCQNHDISQCAAPPKAEALSPEALCERAEALLPQGNIGLAFTYNEPAIGYEYVRDASRLGKERGLVNVMVTNGWFCDTVMEALRDNIDAFNIDLKCFSEEGYQSLGGSLATVRRSIEAAAGFAHLEVTTLVVPGLSDGEEEMEREAAFLASISPDIPLHLSRYFPRWQATAPPTAPALLQRLASIARRHLRHVYLGNC